MEVSTTKFACMLFYLFFMYFVGSLIFTKGFLLKRDVISMNSSCRVDFAQYWDGQKHGAEGCWLHRRFDKAVIILIDALRFDFVAPVTGKDKPFINKMKTVHDLIKHKPKNARLYRFVADPPTTTLQRLKGLTTGSLPTFVDAGSNFASTEVTEDNFIDQLVAKGMKITFLGDDTWTSLFPGRFNRQYPYPSFNVKDLHTVDNGILENIYGELRKKDWDVTIGHFLGVDHCGHRYGPDHPAMTEKLAQMDEMILNITQRLDKDTVLFVMGDHGMTASGDHGGDSDDELDAALFVYSPSQITSSKYKPDEYKTVSQIDLVPTISLLLGAPVPFSNLGTVITDLVNHCSWSLDSHIKEVYHSIEALRVNAHQINEYITQYMKSSTDLPLHKLIPLQDRLHSAENQLQSLVTKMFVNNEAQNAHEILHYLENEYKEFMDGVRELCKEVWAKFDMTSMMLGVLVLAVALLVNSYLLMSDSREESDKGTLLIVVILSLVFVIFSVFQSFYLDDKAVSIMAFILGLFDFITLGIIIQVTRNTSKKNPEKPPAVNISTFASIISGIKKISLDKIIICVMVLVTIVTYFSNSFVVFEDNVVQFLSQTCVWYLFSKIALQLMKDVKVMKDSAKNKSKLFKGELRKGSFEAFLIVFGVSFICSTCIKFSTNFRSKREEQMTEGELSNRSEGNKFLTNQNVSYFVNSACLVLCIYLPRKWLKISGNLNSAGAATLCARYLIPLGGLATVLFWALQKLPSKVLDSLPIWQQIFFPQVCYFAILFSLAAFLFSPLFMYVLPQSKHEDPRSVQVDPQGQGQDLFQKVFKYLKTNLNSDSATSDSSAEIPKVFGLGTIFSSAIVYNSMLLVLLLSVLLGEEFSPCVLSSICAIFCYLELFILAVRLCRDDDLLSFGVLSFGILSSNFFYSFGHQATIPAIRFEAAFIGFHGDWNNKIIPATLIHSNMFAAEILFTFLTPLLVLWPCTKGIVASSSPIWKEGKDSQWKGDFVMHENLPIFKFLQMKMFLFMYLYNGLKLVGSILAAGIHKRHLMVWKIFAPRFVYQAMSSFTVFGVAILSVLVLARVNCTLTRWTAKMK